MAVLTRVCFRGGSAGEWRVLRMQTLAGPPRELGGPFDFLIWFEFAPERADLFDELLAMLRATEEWRYVEREVDIRLSRTIGPVSR